MISLPKLAIVSINFIYTVVLLCSRFISLTIPVSALDDPMISVLSPACIRAVRGTDCVIEEIFATTSEFDLYPSIILKLNLH